MGVFLIAWMPFVFSALETTIGFHQMQEQVQNSEGKEISDAFSPMISLGTFFDTGFGFFFNPTLGYIQHRSISSDTYSDYSMETLSLNYNFIHLPQNWQHLAVRLGFSNFRKTTSDNGKSVTIPNGSSTTTAYRPKSSTTSTMTLNFGLDVNLGQYFGSGPTFSSIFESPTDFSLESYALRMTMNIFSPYSEKRKIGIEMASIFYF